MKLLDNKLRAWADHVHLASNTVDQAKAISKLPFIYKHVALMPDAHLGKGATVGSVIATKGAIIPAAVGVDIGCGMMALSTDVSADRLPDNLFDLRCFIEAAIPVGRAMHDVNDTEHLKNVSNTYKSMQTSLNLIFDK